MPTIRIERVPVRTFNLGLIGFDHLQLVYQQEPTDIGAVQDNWFVIEGLRETGIDGSVLAVEGWDGATSLSDANGGLSGEELEERIGTPDDRGSRPLVSGGNALNTWANIVAVAGDINMQALPYYAFSLASSPTPTINSSSLIASLLYYVGIDIATTMPFGTRLSPGSTTLLGSSVEDNLTIEDHFTTIVAGDGNDELHGSDDSDKIDKLYGGTGDDRLYWSTGFNILNGGQPGTEYQSDGFDIVDYVGAGVVRIDASPNPIEHRTPDFIATRGDDQDYLFSIERLEWNETSDHIILGDGVGLIESSITLQLGEESSTGQGDVLDYSESSEGLVFNPSLDNYTFVQAISHTDSNTGLWVEGAEWLIGSSHDDRIYTAPGVHGAEGGAGHDILDARSTLPFVGESPRGFDVELYGGDGNDTLLASAGRTSAVGGAGADRFVLTNMTFGPTLVEFVIEDAESQDRAFIPFDFVNKSFGGAEGSDLFPLLGAMAQQPGEANFSDLPENIGPWATGPENRSDFFAFEWQLEQEKLYGSDQTEGVIPFAGALFYNREGSDLLIHVFLGIPVEIADTGSDELPWNHVVNSIFFASEAIIRVKDFAEGDLGIFFYDPGEPVEIDIETDHGPYSALSYPNWDASVLAMTNGGAVEAPVTARPNLEVYDPDYQGPGDDENVVAGTDDNDVITLAGSQDTTVNAGAGDDTVETGSGDDLIDGGTGGDQMNGGAGDDIYLVDSLGDGVTEAAQGGIDWVRSSVDFILPDYVEHLALLDGGGSQSLLSGTPGVSGTGNALGNKLFGGTNDNLLSGLDGDDVLFGDTGNDTLDGGAGHDRYVYLAGDGDDLIRDTGPAGDTDVLALAGFTPPDVAFHRLSAAPDDLVITLATGGRILIEGFGSAPGIGIDAVSFDDGTTWTRAELDSFAAAAPLLSGDPPQAQDDFDLVATGNDVVIPWVALTQDDRDFDGDPLSIVSISNVSAGAIVTIEPGETLRLVTETGFEGLVSFTYEISDGQGGTATAFAELAVVPGAEPTNSNPVAHDDLGFETTVGVTVEILATDLSSNDTDADGDALTVVAVADGVHGTASLDGGIITFTPEAGYTGVASFSYTVSDGAGGTAMATASINVSSPAGNVITGTSAGDELTGSAGDDYIDGRGGDDVMVGRGGNDTFRVAGQNGGFDSFRGGAGTDRIQASSRDDIIGLANVSGNLRGIEFIDGGDGFDILRMTDGDDKINLRNIAVTGIERIEGGEGDDIIIGSQGANRIAGGSGNDKLIGRDGDDVFEVSGSGDGFDIYKGGNGTDLILGSAGDDVIGLADAGGNLKGIEAIDGGGGFDILQLTTGDDRLKLTDIAVTGIDRIEAGDGNDVVFGSEGADRIIGGAGDDRLIGGGGDDVFEISGSDGGFDIIKGGEGNDFILGSAGDDVIGLADAGSNLDGIEAIDGGGGFDILRLTSGNDRLDLSGVAVTGIALIEAGDGNDRIFSSAGDDVISGGLGDDVFIFQPGLGHDVITDFETGTPADARVDRIDIRALGVENFSELLSLAEQADADTLITFDADSSLRLAEVSLSQLQADDFRFA
jgi:Ca2+-binding RTX toxin-like protein